MSPVAWVLESILLWHLLVLSGVCSHPFFLDLTVIVLPRTFRLDSSHLTWIYPVLGSPDMRWIIIYLSAPTIGSWWSQQVIMAARHCSSWWRWWSDTLWATLIRLRLHSLWCHLQMVAVEISLQLHRYRCIQFGLWEILAQSWKPLAVIFCGRGEIVSILCNCFLSISFVSKCIWTERVRSHVC
jgi:hypothetical protein